MTFFTLWALPVMTFVALWWFSDVGIWCLFYYDVCRQLWLLSQYSFFSQMVDVLLQLYPRVCCPALLPPRPLLCLAASSCPTLRHTRYSYFFIICPTVLEQNFGFSYKEGLPDSQTTLFRPQPLTREATSLLTNASRLMSLFCVKIRSAPGWTTCVICFTLQRDIVGHCYF